MKRNELIKLRELVNIEIQKRKRIQELLKEELVIEYLELSKTSPINLDVNDITKIINEVLSSFNITKTNGIYVCTNAYYIDYDISYEETNYYCKNVPINSKYIEYRLYKDIESQKTIEAGVKENNNSLSNCLIRDFEKNNIVLNPYNTNKNLNGYNEVRMYFIENAINYGQTKSKRLTLEKYSQI